MRITGVSAGLSVWYLMNTGGGGHQLGLRVARSNTLYPESTIVSFSLSFLHRNIITQKIRIVKRFFVKKQRTGNGV